MKEKENIKREYGENETINPEKEKKGNVACVVSRKFKARSRVRDRSNVHILFWRMVLFYTRVKITRREKRREESSWRVIIVKSGSIRLYLRTVLPPISNRPGLSRVLHSFSTSRQIGFRSFPSDLFAGTLGLLPFYCEIMELRIENDRWSRMREWNKYLRF